MRRILITGGAGFIGINAARAFYASGWAVDILDNLSREGGAENVETFCRGEGAGEGSVVRFIRGDVRDHDNMARLLAVEGYAGVLHLAAQVAVTSSVADPLGDFLDNAHGTLGVLEGVRALHPERRPPVIFASTNKVYGEARGYQLVDEDAPFDPCTPYGVSKACADAYVRDYAKTYGLATVALRQSCIAGPYQRGGEEQGWLAWFARAMLLGEPVTIFGSGEQVRDVLDVRDLVNLYVTLATRLPSRMRGEAYNVGGGPERALGVLEGYRRIGAIIFRDEGAPEPLAGPWRPSDQMRFVCDLRSIEAESGWYPEHTLDETLHALVRWQCDRLTNDEMEGDRDG
jgi:CDP-paratose 2-epimerase